MMAENSIIYKVSRRSDFFLGLVSVILVVIGFIALLYFGNEAGEVRPIVGIVGLSIGSAWFLASYFLVSTHWSKPTDFQSVPLQRERIVL